MNWRIGLDPDRHFLRKGTDALPSALNESAFKRVAVEKEDFIYNRDARMCCRSKPACEQ
jgi:hypothetical protein